MGLNNVNTEKLSETIADLQADLGKARRTFRVEGVMKLDPSGPQFSARLPVPGGEFVLEADQPPSLGGWGTRPSPVQYAVFGLAACYTSTFATVAASQDISLDEVRTVAEFDLNFAHVFGLADLPTVEEVRLTLMVRSTAGDDKLDELAKLAKERCPASYCLTNPIRLTPTVVRAGAEAASR